MQAKGLYLWFWLLFSCLSSGPVYATEATLFPADTLRANLLRLGKERQLSIFFAEDLVRGARVPETPSDRPITELLSGWLDVHCLTYEFIRERFIVIEQAQPCPAQESPSEQVAEVPVPDALDPPQVVEEIIVRDTRATGTRLRQPAFKNSVPLDVINRHEIRLMGYQSLGELLRHVPAVSGNSTSTLISNGGDGTATITLRGLPASNTLVLLNGQRLNTNALSGSAVDLNTLPLTMIERVEIVKDGVSAIYGSDAIAGVVNVITQRDLQGWAFDAYRGGADRGDLDTTQLSLSYGGSSDAWSYNGGMTYYRQGGVFSRDRSRSESSDDSDKGGINKRSSATIPALVGTSSGAQILDQQSNTFRPFAYDDLFEYRDFTSSIVPSERTSAYASVDFQASSEWLFSLDGLYTHSNASAYLAPVPLFTGFENVPMPIAPDQQFNPFGEELFDVRRRFIELPSRRQDNISDTYHFVLSAERRSAFRSLRTALQYAKTRATEVMNHSLNGSLTALALSNDCSAPCRPLDLFGPAGSIDAATLDYLGLDGRTRGTSTLLAAIVELDWRGEDHPWELATGLEHRIEKLAVRPEDPVERGYLVGGGNRGAASGDRHVSELYAEAYLPIIWREDHHTLSAQLATRVSRYDDFGTVVNPRLMLTWRPLGDLMLRTSLARGFRAPSLRQLHGSRSQSFEQLTDPCSLAANVGELTGCLQQSDPALNQFLTITGGDEDLDPERSRTYSAGAVYTPTWADTRIKLSMDFFRINQKDVVESSAQFVINENARSGALASRIVRDANGNLAQVRATLQNIGRRDVEGFDFAAQSVWETRQLGQFTLALDTTHILQFEDKFDPDAPTIDRAGTFSDEASGGLGGLPDWKVNVSLQWAREHWQAHYNLYYVSTLKEKVPLSNDKRTIDTWKTHNFNISYLGPQTDWYRITLGGQNLLDSSPPFAASAFNDSYDGRNYDITGRYLFLKIDKSF